ncbi:hypothetical protein LX36DRAFT_317099 [Colletotrichum falcatum]|nr:hypothetical protein LX36DRAFT_317099 [Colletotrichum falcatum]
MRSGQELRQTNQRCTDTSLWDHHAHHHAHHHTHHHHTHPPFTYPTLVAASSVNLLPLLFQAFRFPSHQLGQATILSTSLDIYIVQYNHTASTTDYDVRLVNPRRSPATLRPATRGIPNLRPARLVPAQTSHPWVSLLPTPKTQLQSPPLRVHDTSNTASCPNPHTTRPLHQLHLAPWHCPHPFY